MFNLKLRLSGCYSKFFDKNYSEMVSMKPGRNDPCSCGSGKKYKKCCQENSEFTPPEPKFSGKGAAPTTSECNQLVALLNAGHYAELESRTRLLLERCPDSGFAWKILGTALKQAGRSADALEPMEKAAALLPSDAEAHSNLGSLFHGMGRLNEAEASYRRALLINPNLVFAHSNLGIVLHELGRLDEAKSSFRRALQLKPDYAEAHSNLGITFYELGRLDEAEASYRWALQVNPNLAFTHNNLGITLHKLGRLGEAEASYRHALQIKPDYADAYGNLGNVLRELGKLDDALACFQYQVRLTPGDSVAQHQIASLTGNNTERAPIQYVENVFDGYADKFDTHLQQVLKYEAPEKLVALITQHSTPSVEKWNVLDLGCGTGLAGLAIAPFARQLVGVDLSAKMLKKAHARNLYQRLERLDLLTMMRAEKASSYNVIIAADVFVYLGKLDEIVSEIKRLLCPGGFFAFSIEALGALLSEEASQGAQREYQLENTGRYAHSVSYITRLVATNGFLPLEMATTQIRVDRGKPVNGYLVLWES